MKCEPSAVYNATAVVHWFPRDPLLLSALPSFHSLHLPPTQIVIYVRATPVIDSTCLSAATTSTPRQCWLSLSRCYYWPCYLNLACNQAAKQMTLVSAFNSNLDTTEFTANNLFGLHIVFRVPHMPKLARMSLLTFICRSLSLSLPACLSGKCVVYLRSLSTVF